MKNVDKKTILLVDDDPISRELLCIILGEDYNIMIATSGEEALKSAMEQPDLILLDVMMPVMDGYEVCRRLKRAPAISDIPVIFVTGLNDPEDEIKGLSLGAVDYLIKPMHMALTLARIKSHLELKQTRDELAELNRNLKQQARIEASKK